MVEGGVEDEEEVVGVDEDEEDPDDRPLGCNGHEKSKRYLLFG